MKTLTFSYIKDLLPDYISKYYSKRAYESYMGHYCEILVENLSYVSKGDIIYRIILPVITEVDRIIDVPSPHSGYIQIYRMEYSDDSILMNFYSSLEEMREENYTYSIVEDKVKKTKRIVWGGRLYISRILDIEFNIKDNYPCLHFRYQGFRLNINDRIFFLDNEDNPIVEMVVVKKDHKYNNNMYEVNFMLANTDMISLTNIPIKSMYIWINNKDTPLVHKIDSDEFRSIIRKSKCSKKLNRSVLFRKSKRPRKNFFLVVKIYSESGHGVCGRFRFLEGG